MFKRLACEDWHTTVYLISSIIILFAFFYFLFRVLTMKKEKVDYMSHLPLDQETPKKLK